MHKAGDIEVRRLLLARRIRDGEQVISEYGCGWNEDGRAQRVQERGLAERQDADVRLREVRVSGSGMRYAGERVKM